MSRTCLAVLLVWPLAALAQTGSTLPITLGRATVFRPPATGGANVVFGSTLDPQGVTQPTIDVYAAAIDGGNVRRLVRFPGEFRTLSGATSLSVSPDGTRAVFAALPGTGKGEEVHVIDVASAADRTVAVYTEGCPQPLCIGCLFPCVNAPHLNADASLVLYSVHNQNPFFTVRADGSGLTRLPIYSGLLAPGPQRVISRTGLVVFSSAAPFGPTFAAAATDVYLMNLDGTNARAVTRLGTDATLYAYNATISADGATIAFESNRDPDTGKPGLTTFVYLVRSDGTGLRAVGPGVSPALSADGSRLAFVREGQIWAATGEGASAITSFKTSYPLDPVIADDGSRVVFDLGWNGVLGAVYAVNFDGSGLHAVYAPRSLRPSGIWGGVLSASPSSGSLVTAYGSNLVQDGTVRADRFPLPESLAGVSLLANGIPLPLLAVTPWQVNAQLPQEFPEGPTAFQLRFSDGDQPAPVAADVVAFEPWVYPDSNGGCWAFYHAGTSQSADDRHPAEAGEVLVSFWTGLGRTDPWLAAGIPAPASTLWRNASPDLSIGGVRAAVTYSGLAPGFVGVYQVNVMVPSGLNPGRQLVSWRLRGSDGPGGCIAVK